MCGRETLPVSCDTRIRSVYLWYVSYEYGRYRTLHTVLMYSSRSTLASYDTWSCHVIYSGFLVGPRTSSTNENEYIRVARHIASSPYLHYYSSMMLNTIHMITTRTYVRTRSICTAYHALHVTLLCRERSYHTSVVHDAM